MKSPDYLTADEVAEVLRIPRMSVYVLAREGKLRAFRLSPRRLRFDRRDVEAYVTSKENKVAA